MISTGKVNCLRTCLWVLVFLFPVLAWGGETVGQSAEASIDFLYINANAGEAAGGHTALRLGDFVFHYQFFPDANFLLVREPWDSFRFLYNDLHNRSIAIAVLPLEAAVAEKIRHHFTELLVGQQQLFDELEALRKEERLVRQLLDGRVEISVDCLGFFSKNQTTGLQTALWQNIEAELEPHFIEDTFAVASRNLQRAIDAVTSGERPGRSIAEALAWREGLRILLQSVDLDRQALIPPLPEEEKLGSRERASLKNIVHQLALSVAGLLHSSRPDRGEALLLQIARYQAMEYSLAKGQLFTLDPFFADVREVQLTDEEMEGEQLTALQRAMLQQAARRRELFFQEEEHPEIAGSLLETSRARAWELTQVNERQRRVRILTKVTLPIRPAVVSLTIDTMDRDGLLRTAGRLQDAIGSLEEKGKEEYGYNLFSRNCATELVRSLNSTFSDPESGEMALGGWLEPDETLLFIPFLFYQQSVAAFFLEDEQFLPARRLRNLETLYEQEIDFLVWLRESNILTSTLYESRTKDTPFLFFTDDSLVLRPLQGILNVSYAALHGIAGIVSLPLDGGKRFNQAARGIFYSLPELAFGNIRKGSYSTGDAGDTH
ncbi:MAG: hypothetical protein K9K37_02370 [Desulfocapsa sp.]|nr:hypothetical protein [Desulfocapsa sp.]